MSSGATRKPVTLVDDHLAECAAIEGDDGRPARLRLGGDHAERLVPPCRAENDGRARHRLPERRSRHRWMDADARLGPSRVDPLPRVFGVIAVAVDIDTDPCRPGDVDGLGRSLLRAQPAGEDGALPRRRRPVDELASGTQGGRIASTGTTRRQALAWNSDTPATVGGASRSRRVTKRGGDRLVRGQVERVHHRRAQCGGEPDRGRVEGVVVDDVVSVLAHSGVDARRTRSRPRPSSPSAGAGSPVERGAQRPVIDAGIDHRNARHLRSGGGVEVDLVTPADQPAREVGNEGL